jgi:hypothetical protein
MCGCVGRGPLILPSSCGCAWWGVAVRGTVPLSQADVHSFYADGAISLHARSLKYGKVREGLAGMAAVKKAAPRSAKVFVPVTLGLACGNRAGSALCGFW